MICPVYTICQLISMYSYLEDIDRSSVGLQQVQTQKNNMNKIEISRVKFTFYMTTPPPPPAPPPLFLPLPLHVSCNQSTFLHFRSKQCRTVLLLSPMQRHLAALFWPSCIVFLDPPADIHLFWQQPHTKNHFQSTCTTSLHKGSNQVSSLRRS